MNKRMMVILIFLIVIAVILVICGTLFRVKSITVDCAQNDRFTSKDITVAADSAMYKNIITVSKDSIEQNIEKSVPYAKVAYVEKCATSTLVIHVQTRYEIVAIKLAADAGYLLADRDMKVLRTAKELPENACFIRGVEIASDRAVAGTFLTDKDFNDCTLLKNMISLACLEIPALAIEDRFVTYFRCIDFSNQAEIRVETTDSARDAEYWRLSRSNALNNFKTLLDEVK